MLQTRPGHRLILTATLALGFILGGARHGWAQG